MKTHIFFKSGISFFTFLISLSLPAQEGGKIIEKKTRQPLSGVHVYVNDTTVIAVTDQHGKFELSGEVNEKDTLRFSYVGYVPEKVPYTELSANNYVIPLQEDLKLLETLTVLGEALLHKEVPYKRLAPLPRGLYAFGSILVEDTIFVSCGNLSYYESIPTPLGIVAKVEIQNFSDRLYKYNIQTDEWEAVPRIFRKRAHYTSQHYNGKLYLAGGEKPLKEP
ncbi:MAG: carboxypeptidase-like regulatory domain-containing protein [Bacteroides sp.]|nr:carboxypeptidase-like regulatory domain-containing protein [Bacteroides sp.]